MNRLTEVFKTGKKDLLNIYCTAGYPQIESTAEVILALQKYGADMVEIGMPYSDPIADGPVIQESNKNALKNGMNLQLLFQQLEQIKDSVHIPVILMGYINPVLQFGIENFCIAAEKAGVSGVIIPDLPMHEYEEQYQKFFTSHQLSFIFLITPGTTKKRINKADELSNGFVYLVSSSSTTGQISKPLINPFFQSISKMNLKNPVMIGFGIKDKLTFKEACTVANGAIIGSAYINALQNEKGIDENTKNFIASLRD
ncbi:MAG: tryptophan synthase subunit alpha [Ferruginibacter sp.]